MHALFCMGGGLVSFNAAHQIANSRPIGWSKSLTSEHIPCSHLSNKICSSQAWQNIPQVHIANTMGFQDLCLFGLPVSA
eukprot:4223983-Amphidinium_carterae.1